MGNLKRMVYLKFARRVGSNSNTAPVPSIIGEGTEFKGDFKSSGTIHIDGKLTGDVTCDELVIGTNGYVKGYVNAKKFHIYGTFEGKAEADSLFIAQTAKLIGDVTHITIAIEPGAYIDGRCIRKDREAQSLTAVKSTAMLSSPEKVKKQA